MAEMHVVANLETGLPPGSTVELDVVEPAEQLVSIYFNQGGSGGQLRGDVENAIRQAIID